MVYNIMLGGADDYVAPATPVSAPPATTAHDEVTDAVDAVIDGESPDEESLVEETPRVTIVTTLESLTPTAVPPPKRSKTG